MFPWQRKSLINILLIRGLLISYFNLLIMKLTLLNTTWEPLYSESAYSNCLNKSGPTPLPYNTPNNDKYQNGV